MSLCNSLKSKGKTYEKVALEKGARNSSRLHPLFELPLYFAIVICCAYSKEEGKKRRKKKNQVSYFARPLRLPRFHHLQWSYQEKKPSFRLLFSRLLSPFLPSSQWENTHTLFPPRSTRQSPLPLHQQNSNSQSPEANFCSVSKDQGYDTSVKTSKQISPLMLHLQKSQAFLIQNIYWRVLKF